MVLAFALSASLVSFLLAVVMYTAGTDYVRSHPGESATRLSHVLIIAVLAATGVGAAVGVWVSRRVLEPLGRISGTAARIAAGDLNTRLPRSDDHDLSPTVDAFNSMVDSLQRRIERERRLVGDVSHELRTPLTTLVTSVGVLQRHADDMPERSRRALGLVADELEHLRSTLDDMLALARVEAGVYVGDAEPLSVASLLRYTLEGRKHAAGLLTVTEDVVISGRKLELERALANLFDNAVRHGGGLTGVTVRRARGEAIIVVDDLGPGVPEAERERIFERFATVGAGRRTATGTGIGLALVAETVAAHGGTVDCADRPGGGARFIVRLPVCEQPGE
ncbi:sensor histidine kinase [Nocardia acididurans]|uniref:sensor histidine kinase n=1 Tax=Nocardia acididurans TaxID=2802282 RepID=UPI0027DACEE6|nr:HAMP domain-containing sensor histidine kinase [Nocardia acididurans]